MLTFIWVHFKKSAEINISVNTDSIKNLMIKIIHVEQARKQIVFLYKTAVICHIAIGKDVIDVGFWPFLIDSTPGAQTYRLNLKRLSCSVLLPGFRINLYRIQKRAHNSNIVL
jgi:hypothetical protein